MNQTSSFQFHALIEEDTKRLAQEIAKKVQAGNVITLDGDLGAGKTTFSQAFAKEMGITEIVNSPTFVLIKEYQGQELPLYHMDVYRLSIEEADELGLEEYFFGNGVCLVEWSSKVTELLPEHRLELYITHLGNQERKFEITPKGELYVTWCEKLKNSGVIS
ncbi:tRNA (adenosine(37)-N6)-threonylcarbamoyltransferase complex ATPase subunit type 1 TsaE [Chengkuizengella sediminis]|uniref:tRNA (adenosine(37)-N6)-threonylcarbamoyltransferase complex ATPase subunit type 1 TsaE n=1 Tax=Chengkuizengella sediminis TaxID=1885917 RepID=UPI00138A3D3C|nr:tRNA (adenosine(37)-N6)-threonylcarbamoyltransferase complex ATPase subunit type 1 TsaE [Chengkuizengella sediminis]NDI34714.1 tRNA (adenosine(37)-N6)-threonylcarbamoyltransferase complex ATPase subunit type 1 TsaE [Chengkuizengella sediminis]